MNNNTHPEEGAAFLPPIGQQPVCGVNINWEILCHHRDVGQVMKVGNCRFVGTYKECEDFVQRYRGAARSAQEPEGEKDLADLIVYTVTECKINGDSYQATRDAIRAIIKASLSPQEPAAPEKGVKTKEEILDKYFSHSYYVGRQPGKKPKTIHDDECLRCSYEDDIFTAMDEYASQFQSKPAEKEQEREYWRWVKITEQMPPENEPFCYRYTDTGK